MKRLALILALSVAAAAWSAAWSAGGEPGSNRDRQQAGAAPTSQPDGPAGSPYRHWTHGPPADESYFPIAVWLQDPIQASRYRQAGFNLYLGLWKGPTEPQLAALAKAGMAAICHQNAVGLAHKDGRTIVGWMHGDEPDNAQSLGAGKGYGPPIEPKRIVAGYERIRRADPTRPVLLNLGQGVAWDGWYGRGVRSNHPEDYPQYVKGCDIASFDIYPVAHPSREVAGKLWYVARGVERLVGWAGGPGAGAPGKGSAAGPGGPAKAVWNCIECTRINSDRKASPQQVRAEVWMSLIHGSRGLIWFVHEWKPKFNEHALLDDAEMLAAVTALNKQIHSLASVLNSPTVSAAASVVSENADVPIALMAKRHGGATYVFAVAMRDGRTTGRFALAGLMGKAKVEVLGEGRVLTAEGGRFADAFGPWDVHLYVVR